MIWNYLAELGVRQAVDDRVVGAGGLGQKDLQLGEDGGDSLGLTPGSHQAEDGERSPRQNPQRNVHDGDLGNADLSWDLVLVRAASQGSNVHFLGLLTHFIFVLEDSLDDEIVAASDGGDGDGIEEREASHDVRLVHHGGGEAIEGATVNSRAS